MESPNKSSILNKLLMVEGSTRVVALMRIILGLVIWTRWAFDVLPWQDLSTPRLLLSVSFFLSSTLMIIGLWSRLSVAWTGLTLLVMYYYFGFGQGVESWTHHHTYALTMATVLLSLTPCGRSYSVDRWRNLTRSEWGLENQLPEYGPLWGTRLIGLQVSAMYFFSAWDKTSMGFLSGERMEQMLMYLYFGSDYPQWVGFHEIAICMSITVVFLEYFLVLGLWLKKTRNVSLMMGVILHGLFYLIIPVSTYTVTMWCMYLVFVDPDEVHAALERLQA